jgi:hypothetical protein
MNASLSKRRRQPRRRTREQALSIAMDRWFSRFYPKVRPAAEGAR